MSSIIISKNQQNSQRIQESHFAREDALQAYLYDNPDIVPIYDLDQDARLFIAAREFTTESGPIDALGFDQSGNIYVIETKLFKNADKRRVVAQAFDYGASLWRHTADFDAFIEQLNTHTQKRFGQTFRQQYAQFFELTDAEDALLAIKSNLAAGAIKFVVLIDTLDERLRDVIIYVNQNSRFDIYAVDFKYYKHEEFEIIIPKLYGAEVNKTVSSSYTASSRRRWNETSFFALVDDPAKTSPQQARTVHALWRWAQGYEAQINWGTGATKAAFSPVFKHVQHARSFCSIASDASISINYGYLDSTEERQRLLCCLQKHLAGYDVSATKVAEAELSNKYPIIPSEITIAALDNIVAAFDEFIEHIAK